ncbi:hypothetical protein CGCVW01_v012980 [Colletotrichum viniferum]|nr:hypothetical protein CGCVW01_v012980 [Colletotrichum viniferum]
MPGTQLQIPGDAPAFAGQVIEILNSVLGSSSQKLSSEDAARAIDELFHQQYQKDDTAGSFLWWFWDLVHDLASQIPYNSQEQEQLTAVIKSLHDLPPKTVSLGQEWGSDGADSVPVWTGLPMFGNTFREKLDIVNLQTSEEQDKQKAVNLQAYAARVAGLGSVPFEIYAIWALVDALEGTMKPIRGAPDEIDPEPSAVPNISSKVAIAANWMKYAGHRLYGRDEEVHGATAGPLWKLDKKEAIKLHRKLRGTDGLCPERWTLWKERFAAVRDAQGVDDAAREHAEAAFDVMEKIEKGGK